jgi:glyoxylase-like metal-dependent hydrolase (beta-lactamase superfamily II)
MRRALYLGLVCLALCAAPVWARPPIEIAAGVYAFTGAAGEPAPGNGGDAGNSGFITSPAGVLIIDSGASYAIGKRRLAALRRKTRAPVRMAILTHATQEFLFGAAALHEQAIPLLAHPRSTDLITQRCHTCLATLRQQLGARRLAGTRVLTPSLLLHSSTTLGLGERVVEILHLGWASTPGDLVVFDRDSGTLFAGGLVVADRVPNLRDADIDGWMAALDRLRQMPVRHIVPGFGAPGGAELIDDTRRYLSELKRVTEEAYARGDGLLDALQNAQLGDYANRILYNKLHPQNVQRLYLKLEQAEFEPR